MPVAVADVVAHAFLRDGANRQAVLHVEVERVEAGVREADDLRLQVAMLADGDGHFRP